MKEKETFGLTEEEIKEKLRKQNQHGSKIGPTRGGRSSGQGVKLLYIRDYLYAYATKEHPKNAKAIKDYLAEQGIQADVKTIYNDILRLQVEVSATDCPECPFIVIFRAIITPHAFLQMVVSGMRSDLRKAAGKKRKTKPPNLLEVGRLLCFANTLDAAISYISG